LDGSPAQTAGRAGVMAGKAVPVWALVSAGLSPILVAGAWLVAGTLQPASYSPVRDTVSVLAGQAGTHRWIMTGALFLVGGCYLVTAAGLSAIRVPARVLLVVAGLSSIGIAASPEPVSGSTQQHLAWTALGAIAITVWPAVTAQRGAGLPVILGMPGSAVVTIVFAALLGWVVLEAQGGSVLGLAERLAALVQTSWPFIVAVSLRRTTLTGARQQDAGEPPRLPAAEAAAGPARLGRGESA
jgi:hypothetical membrane protein